MILFQLVVAHHKKRFGLENHDTLSTMSHLATVYWNHGWFKEAEELGMQVIQTRKRVQEFEY